MSSQSQVRLTHCDRDKMAAISQETIFKRIFFNENDRISLKMSLKFVPKMPISKISSLVQILGLAPARRQTIIWINGGLVIDAYMRRIVNTVTWQYGFGHAFWSRNGNRLQEVSKSRHRMCNEDGSRLCNEDDQVISPSFAQIAGMVSLI